MMLRYEIFGFDSFTKRTVEKYRDTKVPSYVQVLFIHSVISTESTIYSLALIKLEKIL